MVRIKNSKNEAKMKFIPYYQLENKKSIVVDGTPHPGTQLILSHWRGSGTPTHLLRDTSAEIVLDFLENNKISSNLEFVSNDHFDQDGLIGIFSILNPEYSLSIKPLLIDIAEAGDFSKYRDRKAARIHFTIASMVERISNQESNMNLENSKRSALLYQEILPKLRHIIEQTERYREYWKIEDDFLQRSEENIEKGIIKITEDNENKIAFVDITGDLLSESYHWATFNKQAPVHDMAIHNRTPHVQLVYRQGKKYGFKYRYESWVTFQSYKFPLRVDLFPLCLQLNSMEKNPGHWTFSGANDLVPVLAHEGESSIQFPTFLEKLYTALKTSSVAWDPFI
jgi:hypothetical protein